VSENEVIYHEDEREALRLLGQAAIIYHFKIMAKRSENFSYTKIEGVGLGILVGKVEYLEKFNEFLKSEKINGK